jgi:hypothetical protein
MLKFLLSATCLLMLCLSGQAQSYRQGNFNVQFRDSRPIRELTDSHQTVAILPPDAVFRRQSDINSESERQKLSSVQSIVFQQEIYDRLTKASPGRVKYQPVELTNKVLFENNIGLTTVSSYDPADLGRLLGVDAVLLVRGSEVFTNPKGPAVAASLGQVAIAVVAGSSGNSYAGVTETIRTRTELWDTGTSEKVWNFDTQQYRGALAPNTPKRQWMKYLAKRIPYSY